MIVDASKFEARAFQLLAEKLDAMVQDAALSLAQGSARDAKNPEATAQAYCEAAGYIRGLLTVEGVCKDIEDTLIGKNRRS